MNQENRINLDLYKIRSQLLNAITILCIGAPILGEAAFYLDNGQWNFSVLDSAAMATWAILVFIYFRYSKNLELSLKLNSFVQIIFFTCGMVKTGGLHSAYMLYLPLFPVGNGFIFGKNGAVVSSLFMGLLLGTTVVLEKMHYLTYGSAITSSELLSYHLIASTSFTGFIIYLMEKARQLSLKELEEKGQLLNVVLTNIPDMVFAKDFNNDLKFKLFNRAGEKLLGVSMDKMLDKNDHDLFPKEQADFFATKDNEVFENRSVVKIDKEPITTPHGVRWLRTRKVPTFHEDGSPHLLVGISTDITEEVELQKNLQAEQAKTLHNAKLALLGEMSAGVAHEVNNPLAIISLNMPMLKLNRANDDVFEFRYQTIERAARRIEKIVKGLEIYSRTSEGSVLNLGLLSKVIEDSIVMTEDKSKRHATTISLSLQSSSQILYNADEVEQVLINLINNAIDAVKNLPTKWVQIKTFNDQNQVVLQIIDSGAGIPPHVEQKMFQPFFTTKSIGEGTGLGLSIAKGILDQHNATLTLNRDFKNTCFEVRFPAAPELHFDI